MRHHADEVPGCIKQHANSVAFDIEPVRRGWGGTQVERLASVCAAVTFGHSSDCRSAHVELGEDPWLPAIIFYGKGQRSGAERVNIFRVSVSPQQHMSYQQQKRCQSKYGYESYAV